MILAKVLPCADLAFRRSPSGSSTVTRRFPPQEWSVLLPRQSTAERPSSEPGQPDTTTGRRVPVRGRARKSAIALAASPVREASSRVSGASGCERRERNATDGGSNRGQVRAKELCHPAYSSDEATLRHLRTSETDELQASGVVRKSRARASETGMGRTGRGHRGGSSEDGRDGSGHGEHSSALRRTRIGDPSVAR